MAEANGPVGVVEPTSPAVRDQGGRFVKGNPGGPGNVYARRVHEIRSVLYETVTDEDLRSVLRALLREAQAGDVMAAREILDRLLGKPDQAHKIVAAIGSTALTPQQIGELVLGLSGDGPAT